MNQSQPKSIVVGIDGSDAAINAAKWAVPEAVSRDVPLRLLYVTRSERPASPAAGLDLDMEYAETALRTAAAAVHAMGKPVKVETAIAHGSPENALIGESRGAAMICVGSVGIGHLAQIVLGSTAAALARKAHCPVAIIRPAHQLSGSFWIAVVVNDSPDNDAVLAEGFREARLRDAPILALGVWRWGVGEIPYSRLHRRLGRWVDRYPEVHVRPAAARAGAAEFLTRADEPVQLTVVGSAQAGEVARIVGPVGDSLLHRCPACSVLVVRS
ncbi:universal stress protein [Candidatus Mycobacterium methanotrophicum]|uniref:Universal stress protein n=1 Tax=Candidatus Mycobacterium methanotrophicum TaxID=2943498 RepID=A0ABY4QJB3_9MYCO|nr:universal stress protein [Candidatus Mycobacterium methanotrophicum]UQX10327.1 universal stress protein [Candidatus Mycobacterium methanotrophicum]